jgi:HK97 family phage portal protein
MQNLIDLESRHMPSKVLNNWIASRDGGATRAFGSNIKAAFGENSLTQNLTADQLAGLLGAFSQTSAGSVVTAETAMRVTAVYSCVALIAGAISTLPMGIFERTQNTRKATNHEYWWIFNEQANQEMTACSAMEYLISSKMFYGDGFALLIRASQYTNKVIGWRPLHPSRVQPFRDTNLNLKYRVTNIDGTVVIHDPADIIHIPSLGFDGLRSPSPITYAAKEAIGTSIAAEVYSGKFFSQGSTHEIALKTDKTLNKEQQDMLLASYNAKYSGGQNNRMPLLLTGGLNVEKLSITPNDAALLPTRQFGVEEICRVFGVPPHMVGATDKSTSWGSGIEQQGIGFVKYTLRRYLAPIEQELNRKLWPMREKYFVEYNTAALERGDYKTRMEGHRIAIGRAGEPGWMKPNEVRHLENMEPIPDGETLNTGTAVAATNTSQSVN